MRHSKFGLRAFGVAMMAALGLMAFAAVAAQAENLSDGGKAGLFQVLGLSGLVGTESITGRLERLNGVGSVHVLDLVPGRKLTILCPEVHITANFLNDTTVLATFLYLGCKALVFGKETEEIAGCHIIGHAPSLTPGDITATFLALAKKHEGEPYLLFEPAPPATKFEEVLFESGKGCVLPLATSVSGSFVGELKLGEPVVQLLQIGEAVQKLFQTSETLGDHLKYGTFESYIDASITLELNGAHKGCGWGAV